ncbi:hypothetical protein K470DRAFT_278816 [Piedraia hortae CBS 480.64]|uniref:Yeast cell wall synthesis Kre9/Knh1-like N-terminal domain-containing protein n=1 Tax=Piedraia hortae CBS 480.64 TaxID=1314780 RepID=A0A6A7BTH8_9PEZI|nr:hypothetical protein K470DRAFT_278816 [Piedraia hortae CBS 480.64]
MFSILVVSLAALAVAQSTVISFDSVPNPIVDGKAQTIKFHTSDQSNSVTITLRKGASNDLQTVETLTTNAQNGEFVWTPSECLPNGNDYALQITQNGQVNYFGPFSVIGAASSCASSSSSAATAATTSSDASPAGYGTPSSSEAASGSAVDGGASSSSAASNDVPTTVSAVPSSVATTSSILGNSSVPTGTASGSNSSSPYTTGGLNGTASSSPVPFTGAASALTNSLPLLAFFAAVAAMYL